MIRQGDIAVEERALVSVEPHGAMTTVLTCSWTLRICIRLEVSGAAIVVLRKMHQRRMA